ncbi:MAG: SMC-Scp complex subunit ScpB [Prevotella sp.]|nr:SMC-Scp complex subunit ScpB [Prevotella sp.]
MATEILTLPTANSARKTHNGCATENAPSNRVQELAQQMTAILFACGDGLPVEVFCQKLGVSKHEAETALEFVRGQFSGDSGIHLIKYRNHYQFCTNPAYENEVGLVLNPLRERNLTKAALETLAVIAYKQPVTRLEIDQIRGVGSDYALQILSQSNLVAIVGRKEVLGRPLLYGTTDNFLKRFGLDDIQHLPSYEDLLEKIKLIHAQETDVVDLYDSNR